jgi:HKD family nuclease
VKVNESGELMKVLLAENELRKQFTKELSRASEFYLGMALVTKTGLKMVLPAMKRCLKRRGHGCVLFGIDLPTDPDSIQTLKTLQGQYQETFEVRCFQPGIRFFHPKMSIFVRRNGAKTAIVGSSNLTGGGLGGNHEANVLLDSPRIVRGFQDFFDDRFHGAHARQVDQRWLDQYRQLWIERSKVEQRQRKLREDARSLGKVLANVPNRIKGHAFAFTGRIKGWPRRKVLYPRVERRGGSVTENMGSAECLVHADILGDRKTTRKLRKARKMNIPIISQEQFLRLIGSKIKGAQP